MNLKTKTLRRIRPRVEVLEGRALLSAGQLDTSFGTGGYVTNASLGSLVPTAVQPWDSKIVVAGGNAVFRYNSDGTLDTSFGVGGQAATNMTPYAVVTDPTTHKIDVVGLALVNRSDHDYSVSRLNANGTPDTTFGKNGSITVAVGKSNWENWDTPSAAVLDSQGRLVVVGGSVSIKSVTYDDQDTILRFTTTGKLDTTFGSGGIVNGPLGAFSNDGWNAVLIQPDNSITVEGHDSGQDVIASYSTAGALQGRFVIQTPANPYNTSQTIGLGPVAFQSNGDLVTNQILSSTPNNDKVEAVVRYTPTGSLDTSFGNGGLALTDLTTALGYAPGSLLVVISDCLTIDPSGRIVLGGDVAPISVVNGVRSVGHHQQLFVRYTPGGAIDTTFGNGGVATASLGSNNDSVVSKLAAQPDGNLIAIGWVVPPPGGVNTVTIVARYLGN